VLLYVGVISFQLNGPEDRELQKVEYFSVRVHCQPPRFGFLRCSVCSEHEHCANLQRHVAVPNHLLIPAVKVRHQPPCYVSGLWTSMKAKLPTFVAPGNAVATNLQLQNARPLNAAGFWQGIPTENKQTGHSEAVSSTPKFVAGVPAVTESPALLASQQSSDLNSGARWQPHRFLTESARRQPCPRTQSNYLEDSDHEERAPFVGAN